MNHSENNETMKSKAPMVIGGIFVSYLVFVAVIMFVYEPTPEQMDWDDRQAYNQGKLSEISLGQSLEQVRTLLGTADFSEAKTSENANLNVLFYRTHRSKSDGKTTKDECTPLLFKNNQLIAWGEDTYQQYLSAKFIQ